MLILIAWVGVVLTRAQERSLDLYWIDVEGGAATLIVTPAGESILIDTGMPGQRDPGRIFKAAKEAGLKQIDHLITTHFHIDHFGGAADLSALIPLVTVYDSGVPEKNPDNPNDTERFARQIQPYRDMKVSKRVVVKPGDSIPLRASATPITLRCLAGMQKFASEQFGKHPEVDCSSATEKPKDTSDNANSLAFVLSYGDFDMFDGGDLTWNVEAKLVCPENRLKQVDLYDVNHHGLDMSNNPLLVRALAPTVAIMSNGTTKGCGPETFKTLKNTPSIEAVYQIHRNLRPDSDNNTGAEYIANLEKDCSANLIKVSVSPGGKAFTVSIPATGHSRRFESR
jgi:beta-lactamase superfamily II metal-dependent hydrolase